MFGNFLNKYPDLSLLIICWIHVNVYFQTCYEFWKNNICKNDQNNNLTAPCRNSEDTQGVVDPLLKTNAPGWTGGHNLMKPTELLHWQKAGTLTSLMSYWTLSTDHCTLMCWIELCRSTEPKAVSKSTKTHEDWVDKLPLLCYFDT